MSERTANCPNCGAEIVFRWSGAVQTTCPACQSILVRHDLDLKRVGVVGDVPASMSRIQLGTEGRFKGKPFVVVGRIVYRHDRGHWSEWHLRMGNNESAWLSDAQGEYVVTRQVPMPRDIPSPKEMRPGGSFFIDNREYSIASITKAAYVGVEGELPFEYWDKQRIELIDLKYGTDGFGTLDFSEDPPLLFVGEYESFQELALKNLREPDAEAQKAVATKGLNCPPCGAAIELLTGELAQTVACPACGALIDVQDPNLKVLLAHQTISRKFKPKLPLGAVGTLKGVEWRIVGCQVRGITVEGVNYDWREYLLWNADQGFRYLTEYEGHWNDVATVKGAPNYVNRGSQPVVEYLGTTFKHFQAAVATTRFVLGEFPWEVHVDDKVQSDDFVSPPLILSREATSEEVTWSVGTYIDPQRIQQAFNLKEPLPRPAGIFANQPNPNAGIAREYWKIFAVLSLMLLALFIWRRNTARNERAFSDFYRGEAAIPGGNQAFVTPAFELKGGNANVAIKIETDLSNDWAYFNLALLSENGGTGYEIGREVSHYLGVDQGESWREGSPADEALVPNVPGGRYYLRVDTERSPGARSFNYELRVTRDVPRTWPFLVAFLVLLVPPIFATLRERTFEFTRWQESDYAVETESDDDE